MCSLTLWLVVVTLEISIASKPRSVNLALETVLKFDKMDDIKVVNRMQDFLTKIQNILNKIPARDVSARRKQAYQFIDFIEDVITEIKSLEDVDLKEIFKIINKDLKKRKENDIIDDKARRYLSKKLTELRNRPAIEIRNDFDALLRELRDDKNRKNNYVLGFINSLYKRNSEKKLSKIIQELNLFRRSARRSKVNLKGIIEKVVNDVVYEHYNNLADSERRHIKRYIRAFFVDDIPKKEETKETSDKSKDTKENVNTDDESSKSKEQAIEFSSEFTEVPTVSTKKLLTHITLYPKTVKVEKVQKHKFRTGVPVREISFDDEEENSTPTEVLSPEDSTDTPPEGIRNTDAVASNELFANHSVEINVNLMLKANRDSRDRPRSKTYKKIKPKTTTEHILQRATKTITKKRKKHTTTHALPTETFGNLYRKTNKNVESRKRRRTHKKKLTETERTERRTTEKTTKTTKHSTVHGEHRRANEPVRNEDITDKPTLKHYIPKLAKKVNLIEKEFTEERTTMNPTTTAKHRTVTSITIEIPTISTTIESYVDNEIFENVTQTDMTDKTLVNTSSTTKDSSHFDHSVSDKYNNTSSEATIKFDVEDYLKKSEFQNMDDKDKMRDIEEKLKADLNLLLSSTPSNVTEGVTDVFKELENAFDI